MSIFSDITVIDFSKGIPGNLCTMVLGDLGAQVIHIDLPDEKILEGVTLEDVSIREMSLLRGKKRVALDPKNEAQLGAIYKLVEKADVFVEDRAHGKAAEWGLDYHKLTGINPQICYTAISYFGQTGPLKDKPASDLVMQAYSGLMSITGEMNGGPMRVGLPVTEMYGGLYGAIGTIGMLINKKKTGEGQYLDLAISDCMVTILENAIINHLVTGDVQKRIGNRHSVNVPFQEFHTKDDQDILITINRDNTYAALCKILGCEELIDDPRYCNSEMRRQNRESCTQEIIDRVINWNVDDLEKELTAAGIPCATINSVDMIVNLENTEARNMLIKGSHPQIGEFDMPNSPFKFSATPVCVNSAVSTKGMDTEDVLNQYGIN